MSVHDLRLFILILEIIILVAAYVPVVIYAKSNKNKKILVKHLDIAYSVMWFITGIICGMSLISILSAFVK